MPFLVLTRSGFDDLKTRDLGENILLYLNPGLLQPEEISWLRTRGAEVRLLPSAVDAHASDEVQVIARLIEQESSGPIWVEHAPAATLASASLVHQSTRDSSRSIKSHDGFPHQLIKRASDAAHWAIRQVRKGVSLEKPLLIVPYLGYGTPDKLVVRGRVLQDEGFSTPGPEDSAWRNLAELYKRLESDEVAGARVRASFNGVAQEAVTDRDGYFCLEIILSTPLSSTGWHTVEMELVDTLRADGKPVRATTEVLVPPPSARFGVISDIDDTILWTNATNRLNMLLMLGRSNAHTRKPFKGVAAFYRALHSGVGGNENNPLFYVSSSPWHLFTPIIEFMRLQDIPLGPLMLKELKLRTLFGPQGHHTHKLEKIESILRLYPHLQFILIGDSGEQDPEIYAEVVKRYPQAVRAIYIRNVNPDPSRIEALDRLIEEVRTTGAQLILAPDSEFAAAHAVAEGIIRPYDLASVRSDKKDDEPASRADQGLDRSLEP